jgi:hypothetical protein
MSTRVRLCSAGGHCAPRGGGVKDLTAAVRSALSGRSLTPSPDPGALTHQAEARQQKHQAARWVGLAGEVLGLWLRSSVRRAV